MNASKIFYIFWKIIGFCPFNCKKDGTVVFSYCGAIYSTILSIFYTISYLRVWDKSAKIMKAHETIMSKYAEYATRTSELLMIVTIWLHLGYRQNAFGRLQKLFRKFVESCEILGISEIHSFFVKSLKRQLLIFNCSWFVSLINCQLQASQIPTFNVLLWLPINVGRIVYPNFMIIFINAMWLLRCEFRSLNEKIRENSRRNRSITVHEARRPNEPETSGIEFTNGSLPLVAYGQLHSELVDLTVSVVEFWSLPLYLTIAAQSLGLGRLFFEITIILKNHKIWPPQDNPYFMWACFYIVLYVIGIIAEVAVSDSTANEANRTGSILHESLVSNPSQTHFGAAKMVSLRLFQRPLTITVLGVFQMRFAVVYTIGSMVTTYVTIMMQLDDLERERSKIYEQLPDSKID